MYYSAFVRSNYILLGPDLPEEMDNHCLETIPIGLFVMSRNLHTYIYEFEASEWMNVTQTFPCDHKNTIKVNCKSNKDEMIIVPSVKKKSSCTGLFDLTTKTWSQMENDNRNAPYNGFLQHLPNSKDEEILLYFGGYEYGNKKRSNIIWKFNDHTYDWEIYPIRLSSELTSNTVAMTLLHPNICQD